MVDPTVEEEVRRMKHGSRNVMIGLCAGIFLTLILGMLFLPFVTQPSITETLPKVMEPSPAPVKPSEPSSGPLIDLMLPEDAPPGARKSAEQTVIVFFTDMEGTAVARGSGLLIRDGVVLTAAHLHTSAMTDMRIGIYCDGQTVEGQLIKQAEERDLAIIRVPACAANPIRLSREEVDSDDALYATGFVFPSDGRQTWAKRYFETSKHVPNSRPDTSVLEDDAAEVVKSMRANNIPELEALRDMMVPGQSGSPVVLASGDLVGVLILNYPRRSQRFMVPAESIAVILKEVGIGP